MGRERSESSEIFEIVRASQESSFLTEQADILRGSQSSQSPQKESDRVEIKEDAEHTKSGSGILGQHHHWEVCAQCQSSSAAAPPAQCSFQHRSQLDGSGHPVDEEVLKSISLASRSREGQEEDSESALQNSPETSLREPELRRGHNSAVANLPLPGAYSGQPGNELRRVEKISFSIVGSNAAREEGTTSDDVEARFTTDPSPLHAEPDNNQIAVARPVTGTSQDFLPQAEEDEGGLDPKTAPDQQPKRLVVALVVAFVVVACAVIPTCILLLSGRPKKEAKAEAKDEPTISLDKTIKDLLPAYTLPALTKPNSPQSLAYEWMVADPMWMNYSNERILQRFVLTTLHYGTNGQHWFNNTNWLSYEQHECQWFATNVREMEDIEFGPLVPQYANVRSFPCEDGQHYSHLWLFNNNLHGELPLEVYSLSSLKSISLDLNHLQGSTISTYIGTFPSLQVLTLGNSAISGSIPTQVGLISTLTALVLTSNSIHATIPSELYGLAKLQDLHLDLNQFSGTISSQVGYLTDLQFLNLFDTQFTGELPSQLGLLDQLELLSLDASMLTAEIPTELGSMKSLRYLYLNQNFFSGTVAAQIGHLESLSLLYLQFNELSASIPSELGQLTLLEEAFLGPNPLMTGQLPSEIGLMTNLLGLSLHNTATSGPIPQELSELVHGGSLLVLDIRETLLSGTVPNQLCDLNTSSISCFVETFECSLWFDCSETLCGCDCPCSD